MRTLAYVLYVYVDMWLQEDNIMAMAVHVRTILGCRNFHRLNLADQDSAGRLVSELAAQVYISIESRSEMDVCMNARMHEEAWLLSLLLSSIDPTRLGPTTERDVAARPAADTRRVVRV